ncbi:MAG TPA: M4 family metallopeptidase [Polyangiaceae bacterium]|jgi:Zn-dependent metalloprotease|nr:M4 family metallopeptidase [Polyangiaceae bacterium]
MGDRFCTCFIVPPRVLRHLADKAQGADRNKLLDSALLSEYLRGHRTVRAMMMFANVTGEKRRTIYDCGHKQNSPPRGRLVLSEGGAPTKDDSVNQAYDSAGTTYDFYRTVLNRNSVDDKGMRLDSFVHFGKGFNNAFWDGAEMTYGDGDGKMFLGFTGAIDVVAHELTHGVTQFSTPGGLDYQDQSGALNESISDCFGSVVKQWSKKQSVGDADWLIGQGIMAAGVGKALRSMKSPGDQSATWEGDDQPASMSGYVEGGDVHTNSGIPNHAFYLAAMALGGNSWDKAAKIWYAALPSLKSDATFADAAKATSQAAARLFGSKEQSAVDGAWKQVKVT